MQPSALSARLDAGLREFAWDEWGQMGVLATPHRRSRWVQDPEALIVFSLEVGRDDPRLFDAVLGWMLVNERLLSVRRLRGMTQGGEDERLLSGALGWLSGRRPRARLAPRPSATAKEQVPESLFRGLSVPVRSPDPAFAAVGFVRPAIAPSDSGHPDLRAPVNLGLRLRELLGVGARAEVVRFLLTVDAPFADAAAVARSAGFAKRNVHDALASLAAAGAVSRWTVGNQQRYAIDRAAWANLLGRGGDAFPRECAWPQLLPALITLRRALHDPALDDLSDYLRASRARDLLEQLRADLAGAGVPVGSRPGLAAWDDLEALVEHLMLELSSGDPYPGE